MKYHITGKSIISVCLAITSLLSTSCSDFTEIDPKGKNLLSSTSDLELLLNGNYSLETKTMQEISGDLIYALDPLAVSLQPPVKTKFSIIVGWDEAGHRDKLPELTNSDSFYAGCYEYIGKIANPILSKIDEADGNESDRLAIKAEALVIRAYFHYLAIQKFAPAYDMATASSTIGLAYVKEDQDIKLPTIPISLDRFYDNIIADLDEAINLNALPEKPLNQMRFSLVSAYAIKAHVLMAMQQSAKAAEYAQKAININGTVANYNNMLVDTQNMLGGTYKSILRPKLECPEDYFSDYHVALMETYPTWDTMEDGHAIRDYFSTASKFMAGMFDASLMMLGVPGLTMSNDLTSSWPTISLSAPQMYLILAENSINEGNFDKAMSYLDIIREGRISPSKYAPLEGTVSDKASAIEKLKTTARGEWIFSVWGFINYKRWTSLEDYKETITRNLCGIDMTLSPDSRLWVFPIPQNVINNNPNFKPYLND